MGAAHGLTRHRSTPPNRLAGARGVENTVDVDLITPASLLVGAIVAIVARAACRFRRRLDRVRLTGGPDEPRLRIGNNPRYGYSFGALALAVAFTAIGVTQYEWSTVQAWLIGVNVAVLVAYGFDKLAAVIGVFRVPEFTLHLLAATGGTVGALLGQDLFNHKSNTVGFRRVFWVIAVVQVALLIGYARSRTSTS